MNKLSPPRPLLVAAALYFAACGTPEASQQADTDQPAVDTVAVEEQAVAVEAPAPPKRSTPPTVAPESPPAPAMASKPDTTTSATPVTSQSKFRTGEDPDYAARMGWPVKGPTPIQGAILPDKRIVCYYGNPKSKKMGALGEYPKDEMLARLKKQIREWEKADPAVPVMPCLHMVAVVAQGDPGKSGHWRTIQQDALVEEVHGWAKEAGGIFIVDIQVGTDDIRNLLPRFEWILKNPDVHLAVDPEFYMKGGERPGSKIGTMNAADINYVSGYLADLVKKHNLPAKTLVIHRFTRPMVKEYKQIRLRPEVQIVMHMDGWGAPWLKRDSYRDYIVQEPVQYTGFKLFYHNDTKKGDPLMQPKDVLKLEPKPIYIQYQ